MPATRTGLPSRLPVAACILACCAVLTACATAPARPEVTRPVGWVEEGLASWYGEPYHGRATASGERYDMSGMTAAHRSLPFGTRARVRNLENGREVIVTINDRGPFVAGRILDLSRGAADALEAVAAGVVRVRLEVLEPGDGMPRAACWEVQVGAFAEADNARRARERLEAKGLTVVLAPAGGGVTRVRATGLGSRERARALATELESEFPGAAAVPCGGRR